MIYSVMSSDRINRYVFGNTKRYCITASITSTICHQYTKLNEWTPSGLWFITTFLFTS